MTRVIQSSLRLLNHVSTSCSFWKSSWLPKQSIKAGFLGRFSNDFKSLAKRHLRERESVNLSSVKSVRRLCNNLDYCFNKAHLEASPVDVS